MKFCIYKVFSDSSKEIVCDSNLKPKVFENIEDATINLFDLIKDYKTKPEIEIEDFSPMVYEIEINEIGQISPKLAQLIKPSNIEDIELVKKYNFLLSLNNLKIKILLKELYDN